MKKKKKKRPLRKWKWPFYVLISVLTFALGALSFELFATVAAQLRTPLVESQQATTHEPTASEPTPLPQITPTSRFEHVSADLRMTRIPVLMYHDVQDIAESTDNNVLPKAQFEAQLQYLADHGFTTITVDEFIAAYNGTLNLPKKSVLITFDDGFQSIKTLVEPLLTQYGMHATAFIIGSYTERPDWHLTTEDIRALQQSDSIDLESHTFDLHHNGVVARGAISEASVEQIVADNTAIETLLQKETAILCYPFGDFSDSTLAGLQAADIPFGFAISSGTSSWVYLNPEHQTPSGEIQNPLALPRVRINANLSIDTFASLITDDEA